MNSLANDRVLLGTSIAPGRIEVQRAAVESWLAHGFDVVSLNTAEEVEQLAPAFPGVAFVRAGRNARLLAGKPLVFVNDLLSALAQSGEAVVGLVNSDIRFDPIDNLRAKLHALARQGLVCGPRLDVAAWDDPAGSADPLGFDLFVFESRIIATTWVETRLCLGQGFWDHWLPLQAILAGHRTFKLAPPVMRHIRHATARDDSFFIFADEFASLMTGYMAQASRGDAEEATRFGAGFPGGDYIKLRARAMAGAYADVEAFAVYLDRLSRYVVRFIDRSSRKVAAIA